MKVLVTAAAAALALCTATPALAGSDDAAVLKTIHQFADGLNAGDANKALTAVSAENSVVIDEFAPFVWQGKTGIADWFNDYGIDTEDNGITGAKVTVGDPIRVESDGKSAYVLLPVTYDYQQKGVAMHEDATMTCTLSKATGAWLLTGWSWNGQKPAKAN